jgi:hypothetical protein
MARQQSRPDEQPNVAPGSTIALLIQQPASRTEAQQLKSEVFQQTARD